MIPIPTGNLDSGHKVGDREGYAWTQELLEYLLFFPHPRGDSNRKPKQLRQEEQEALAP